MRGLDGSERVGNLCGTALAYADTIHRRVIINKESSMQVSLSLGFTHRQVNSVVRILVTHGGIPSLERLAVIAMQAPGIDDDDIADWFGKLKPWAAQVRANADAISRREFIPACVAWVADEWEPDDPTPDEIRERCRAIRAIEERPFRKPDEWTAPQFHWHGGHIGSFIPVRP